MELPLTQLKALLEVLDEGGASEFEYRDESHEIRVVMARGAPLVTQMPTQVAYAPAVSVGAASAAAPKDESDPNVVFVTSPFVGTFYRSSSPGAAPFVEVGASVKPGQTLCIVEAMKLMNELEAEFPCVILEALVENSTSVEFGQKLFKVKKS